MHLFGTATADHVRRYYFTQTFSIRQRSFRRILAGVTNLIGSFKNRPPYAQDLPPKSG